jgi:hypothetical protein
MAKKKYTVQTPVRHDGKDYAPNDSIELDIPDDHTLLTDGVVADGKAVKAKAVKETPVEPQPAEPVTEPEAPTEPTEAGEGA